MSKDRYLTKIIAINVGYPKNKLNIVGYYRQFNPLNQNAIRNDKWKLAMFDSTWKKISKLIETNNET